MRFAVALRAALCLAIPGAASAHVGSFVIPVYELSPGDLPDLQDQTLADWEESLPDASATHFDFQASIDELRLDSLAFRVFLAWSARLQQLYVAVDRVDDIYVGYGEFLWLLVDGDHSGGQYRWSEDEVPDAEERGRRNYAQAQMYLLGPAQDGGPVELYGDWLHGWAARSPYVEVGSYAIGERPSRSGVEVALTCWDALSPEGPEASRRSELYPGKVIGLRMSVLDADEPPGEDGRITAASLHVLPASPAPGTDGDAGTFADAELIPCYLPGCSRTTSVLPASWARIKASLR